MRQHRRTSGSLKRGSGGKAPGQQVRGRKAFHTKLTTVLHVLQICISCGWIELLLCPTSIWKDITKYRAVSVRPSVCLSRAST